MCHAEGAAKTAAVIRTVDGHKHQALNLREQLRGLIECRANDFGRLRDSQTPDGAAAVVKSDGMPELGPREGFDFQNVVQKFNQLVCICSNLFNVIVLFDAIEVTANLLNAAPRWRDDTIAVIKVFDRV